MSRMIRSLGVALAVVALIEGARLLSHDKVFAKRDRQTSSVQPDISALASEVASLRSDVRFARLQAQIVEASRIEAPVVPSSTPAEGAPEALDPETAAAEAQQRREEYIATIDRSFVNEFTDRTWASTVSREIDAVLRSDEIKLTSKSVECRSSACRLEVSDDGTGTVKKALPLALARLGGSLPNTIAHQAQDSHGNASTVLYMFRGSMPADETNEVTGK